MNTNTNMTTAPMTSTATAAPLSIRRSAMTGSVQRPRTLDTASVVDLLVGTDPQRQIDSLIAEVKDHALQTFLQAVTQEPQIHALLTVPLERGQSLEHPGAMVQMPIQILRRVALNLHLTQARTRQEKDVLLVAGILWGVCSLLAPTVFGNGNVHDVFCTLIRPALHRLDDQAYETAQRLRQLLGLGYEEDQGEEGNESIKHLQTQLKKSVQQMHQSKPWLLDSLVRGLALQAVRGRNRLELRHAH